MCKSTDLVGQFLLGPAGLLRRPKIPSSFFHRQLCLQNDYILRPADFHSEPAQFRDIFIDAEELTHPAQIARRETYGFRICRLQIFGSGYGCPLFCSGTNGSANLEIQLHLW